MKNWVLTIFLAAGALDAGILQNGDFEVGMQDWGWNSRGLGGYPKDIKTMNLDPSPEVASDAAAPSGKHILKFKNPPETSFTFGSREYLLPEGKYKAIGFFNLEKKIKWTVGDTVKTLGPTSGWEMKELDFAVTNAERAVSILINAEEPGIFQLDQFQIAPEGTANEAGIDLGLEVSASDKIFMEKDEKNLAIRAFSPKDISGTVFLRIENGWGEEVLNKKISFALTAGQIREVSEKIKIQKTGHYRVLAQFRGEKGVSSYESELLFALIPNRELANSTVTGEDSRFGCNTQMRPYLIETARKIGIRWVMCAPPLFTKWFASEPRKGEWLYYDEEVKKLNDAGIHILGNLADAPSWALRPDSKDYGGPWPNNMLPEDWSGWQAYVRNVVDHYSNRIKYWAVWNEPDHPGFLKLTNGEKWFEKYETILEKTFQVAKSAVPDIRIVGGVATHPGALLPLIQGKSLRSMDIGGFHWLSWTPKGYVRNTSDELGLLGPKETSDNCIETLTDAMDLAKKKIPLWDTECHFTQASMEREFVNQPGPPIKKGATYMTRLDGAAAIPRQHLAEWAAGIDKTFFWLLESPFAGQRKREDTTMLEWDRSPGAQVVTYAVMTSLLEKARFVKWEKKMEERNAVKTFYFATAQGGIRVVFSDSDTPKDLVVPVSGKTVSVRDMFGVEQEGADSFNGIELKGKVHLSVTRFPVYVLD